MKEERKNNEIIEKGRQTEVRRERVIRMREKRNRRSREQKKLLV